MFYKHTGNFEDNDLEIHCEDLFPMDLGTSGWTEFKMTPDVTAYIADNLDLFDCETGLIHSHHTMGAFFSGQDTKTLQSEGNDTNCFVSLIVDTKGTYQAAITRKVQKQTEVMTKSLGTSYEFFGEGPVQTGENPMSESTRIVDEEIIEYFMLDVEREEVDNHLDYLDERFDEIEKAKATLIKPNHNFVYKGIDASKDTDKSYVPFNEASKKKPAEERQLKFWDDEELKEEVVIHDGIEDWIPDPDAVDKAVTQILLCSLLVNPKNVNLDNWVSRMDSYYDNFFKDIDAFNQWCDFIIQYVLDHFNDDTVPDSYFDYWDIYQSTIAFAIYTELEAYENNSKYIKEYLKNLESYII